jgi:outer membrane protein insertion porin family
LRRLDQFGEIRLEGNLEERFPIFGNFQGAVFLDAGNIWTMKDTTAIKKDLANFSFNRFYREIAIGTGFGLRYDFSFFIIRVDIGIKMRDPAFVEDQRWVIQHLFDRQWKRETWRSELSNDPPSSGRYRFPSLVVGINYPF